MKWELPAIFLTFFLLVIWTFAPLHSRQAAMKRSRGQWAVDFAGLFMHGTLVPLFQTFVIFGALTYFFPGAHGVLEIPAWLAFALNFIVVDYAYYWNHRWLHTPLIWPQHAVHHSGETFDVFTTSRNTAWTTFLILYVWVNGLILFLLKDPAPYAWAVAASNILDLLRHSRIQVWPRFFPFNFLISPKQHAWHHSRDLYGVNFGGNLNLWDRLHGTYHADEMMPASLGADLKEKNHWRLFWKGSA
jgi:sterol desaturase/sphingolipid hydroxylase (fatty acid hydroxylase superfamily)